MGEERSFSALSPEWSYSQLELILRKKMQTNKTESGSGKNKRKRTKKKWVMTSKAQRQRNVWECHDRIYCFCSNFKGGFKTLPNLWYTCLIFFFSFGLQMFPELNKLGQRTIVLSSSSFSSSSSSSPHPLFSSSSFPISIFFCPFAFVCTGFFRGNNILTYISGLYRMPKAIFSCCPVETGNELAMCQRVELWL